MGIEIIKISNFERSIFLYNNQDLCNIIMPYKNYEDKLKRSREYGKEYYQRKKDDPEFKADRARRHREYVEKIREMIFDVYGDICTCCGETEKIFLTIDHINNDGAEDYKKHGNYKVYKRIIKEADHTKYQILCYNCNRGRYMNGGICPHKKGGG